MDMSWLSVGSVRISLAALCAAGLWHAWSQNQQPAALTLEKVTDNLYVISGSGGNVAFMPTSEGVILVDDKFAQDAPQILAKVKSVSDRPIRYIFNTHQHGDHTGGNAAMLATNVEIVIHKNARANMAAGNMSGQPRITFSDESQIFLGGKEVQAKFLGRGHTNGDAVIYFPSERVLHTGDLFTNTLPNCDTSTHCSIKDWSETLTRALAYDFDLVIPGHGPVMHKVDVAKYAQNVAVLRDRLQKQCSSGTPQEISKRLDFTDLGWPGPTPTFIRSTNAMCRELTQ